MIAADIMSRMPISIGKNATLAESIRLMSDHRISGLPVVDEAGGVVGMLTEGDLLRRVEIGSNGEPAGWFAQVLHERKSRPGLRAHACSACQGADDAWRHLRYRRRGTFGGG